MHSGNDFAHKHADELKNFLFNAEAHGYGSGVVPYVSSDGTKTIIHKKGDWLYTDTWYGGEPYAGITTIAYKGKIRWVMVYWGGIFPGHDERPIYECLTAALMAPNRHDRERIPVRGPANYMSENGYVYSHSYSGIGIKRFYGHEIISLPGSGICYRMDYHGGFVDLR